MTGYSPEQLNSGELRWDTLTPPEWIPVTLHSVEELRSTGSSSPFEKEYVRPDGSRWWGLFAGKMLDSSSGIEFVIDITERKRAEEALRESEEKYRTLVENVGDYAIFMLDPEGFVTEWTRSAERVKGYAPEEVLGRHFSMFNTPQGVAAGSPSGSSPRPLERAGPSARDDGCARAARGSGSTRSPRPWATIKGG